MDFAAIVLASPGHEFKFMDVLTENVSFISLVASHYSTTAPKEYLRLSGLASDPSSSGCCWLLTLAYLCYARVLGLANVTYSLRAWL